MSALAVTFDVAGGALLPSCMRVGSESRGGVEASGTKGMFLQAAANLGRGLRAAGSSMVDAERAVLL